MISWGNALVVLESLFELQTSKGFPRVKYCRPRTFRLLSKMLTNLSFIVLPHLKYVDFIYGLPVMKELNMFIQSLHDLVLSGEIPFSCESQPRRA